MGRAADLISGDMEKLFREIVDAHHDGDGNVEDVTDYLTDVGTAASMALCVSYLLFRESTGISFKEFVAQAAYVASKNPMIAGQEGEETIQ